MSILGSISTLLALPYMEPSDSRINTQTPKELVTVITDLITVMVDCINYFIIEFFYSLLS